MERTITLLLPDKLLDYLLDNKNWSPGNSTLDEEIADILNDHLCEYARNYYTSCEEWKKIKTETYQIIK